MSNWSYVNGIITVNPLGRTQAEKRYILDTVLDHLPVVSGSEKDMDTYIIQKKGYNVSDTYDEFNQKRIKPNTSYRGDDQYQTDYFIIVDGQLRDRQFVQTLKEFNNWLCRLAKRVGICDMTVTIRSSKKEFVIRDSNHTYSKMVEDTLLYSNGTKENWCEYLMFAEKVDDDGYVIPGKPTIL